MSQGTHQRPRRLLRAALKFADRHVVATDPFGQFHCAECDGDFDADAVRQQVQQWQAVLNWIAAAPAIDE